MSAFQGLGYVIIGSVKTPKISEMPLSTVLFLFNYCRYLPGWFLGHVAGKHRARETDSANLHSNRALEVSEEV